jgi:hypothetical protein
VIADPMAGFPAGARSPVRTPDRPSHPQADATVGDFPYVPPGCLHGFRNQADEPASILMLFAPGGPREQHFESTPDMTDEQRREFLVRHDNYDVQNGIAAAPRQDTMGTTLRANSKRPQLI